MLGARYIGRVKKVEDAYGVGNHECGHDLRNEWNQVHRGAKDIYRLTSAVLEFREVVHR